MCKWIVTFNCLMWRNSSISPWTSPLSDCENSSSWWEYVATCPLTAVVITVLPRLTITAPGQKSARDVAVLELSWQEVKGFTDHYCIENSVAVRLWNGVAVSTCYPPFPVAMKHKPNLEYNYGAFAFDYINTGMHGHSYANWLAIRCWANSCNDCVTQYLQEL